MGILIERNDEEVWSPSMGAGTLFIDQVAALEKWLGQESGIVGTLPDTFKIDAPKVTTFIRHALQELDKTNDGPLFALASGCNEIMIALNARMTGNWPQAGEQTQPIVERARSVLQPPWYYEKGRKVGDRTRVTSVS